MSSKFLTSKSGKLVVKQKLNALRNSVSYFLPLITTVFISKSWVSSVEKQVRKMSTAKSSKISSLKSTFKREPSELAVCQHLSNFLNTNISKKKL